MGSNLMNPARLHLYRSSPELFIYNVFTYLLALFIFKFALNPAIIHLLT